MNSNRLDMIVTHAWEKWTKNGLGMDADERESSSKSVRKAAKSVYHEMMSDMNWLAATIAYLDNH